MVESRHSSLVEGTALTSGASYSGKSRPVDPALHFARSYIAANYVALGA